MVNKDEYIICIGADSTEYVVYRKRIDRIVERVQCMQWYYITLVSRGDWSGPPCPYVLTYSLPPEPPTQWDPCPSQPILPTIVVLFVYIIFILNKQTFIRLWQPLTKAGLHRHTKLHNTCNDGTEITANDLVHI